MSFYKKPYGFSLLEILMALALMATAVLGIYQGQASAVKATVRSEYRAQATALAQEKMTELEIILKKKGLQTIPEEEKGEFKNKKFERYKWIRKVTRVDLGCFIPQEVDENGEQSSFFSLASDVFEEAVRKIQVEVEWNEGKRTHREVLTQLFVRFEDVAQ
jgi:prepilin-type N-terminal cleavage/methylation domain-containing protein